MARAIPLRKTKKTVSSEEDSFSRDVRQMVEQRVVAVTEAYSLKSKMVELIQKHSAEIQLVDGGVSEFFLDICDMIVTGDLSKMQPDAFKVYLVTMAYGDSLQESFLDDMDSLAELTGITELSALAGALDQLRRDGYIDSANKLVSYANKRSRRKPEGGRGGLLDRFAV